MAEHKIQTNYGDYVVPDSVAIIMEAAKRRRDGHFDRRTAAHRFISRYQYVADLISELAYVTNVPRKMPEANDIDG